MRWQYTVRTVDWSIQTPPDRSHEALLQDYGGKGWEVVSATPINSNGTTKWITYVFRKPA